MIRMLSIAAAATLAALPIAAGAQGPSAYYVATPVAAPAKTIVITNGTVWKWSNTSFVANQGPQRDVISCQMIAQSAGKLSAFSAAGKPFDAPLLEKCNARAK